MCYFSYLSASNTPVFLHRQTPPIPFFQLQEENSNCGCFVLLRMADSDRSSDDVSVDSRDDSSRDSKLEFSEDEETLIARMFNLLGERWSLIAGRIPGRTAEEIEKYWTSRYSSSE